MVSWIALPWHFSDFQQFKNDTVVSEAIRSQSQDSGLYMVPNFDPKSHEDESKMEEFHAAMQTGPYAFMIVKPEGVSPSMGSMMAIGFLLNFITAFLLMWLVSSCSITNLTGRTIFVAVAGTVGALYPHVSNWNWWFFPAFYCAVGVIDLLITWSLAGYVMVKVSDKIAGSSSEA